MRKKSVQSNQESISLKRHDTAQAVRAAHDKLAYNQTVFKKPKPPKNEAQKKQESEMEAYYRIRKASKL